MSEGAVQGDEYRRQEFSWSNFEWYLNFFRQYGLEAFPFYWNSDLRKENVDILMHHLRTSEVVILGGGNPFTGLNRYRELGARFYGNGDLFNRILHERQAAGLLTVGFSAGVDQLCQFMCSAVGEDEPVPSGFGLCRNIVATSHFENGREDLLATAAMRLGHCLAFGLPNDSGIAINQGMLPSGNIWQVIRFITDNSWDIPSDQFHIKTRHGMKIQHIYPDGRNWAFDGGDSLVRIQSRDNSRNEAYIMPANGPIHDYWLGHRTDFSNIGDILAAH